MFLIFSLSLNCCCQSRSCHPSSQFQEESKTRQLRVICSCRQKSSHSSSRVILLSSIYFPLPILLLMSTLDKPQRSIQMLLVPQFHTVLRRDFSLLQSLARYSLTHSSGQDAIANSCDGMLFGSLSDQSWSQTDPISHEKTFPHVEGHYLSRLNQFHSDIGHRSPQRAEEKIKQPIDQRQKNKRALKDNNLMRGNRSHLGRCIPIESYQLSQLTQKEQGKSRR
jgi:hypothetical protein